MKASYLILIIAIVAVQSSPAQTFNVLQERIQRTVEFKNMLVGVAIGHNEDTDITLVNGNKHFPMQSVFKLPIAFYVLSEIDKGNLSLDQKINITREQLLPETWSPIREKYPKGTKMSLSELLKYTVASSDNNGCDILLNLVGGPGKIEEYMHSVGIEDISIKFNEAQMHEDWNRQYENWITPKAADKMLKLFFYNRNNLLSMKSYRFIWKVLKETKTGADKIKGGLPKKVIVAHKTGNSGTNEEGLTAAENDIGVIFLPNKNYLFLCLFVTNSVETPKVNKDVIANISKECWEHYKTKH